MKTTISLLFLVISFFLNAQERNETKVTTATSEDSKELKIKSIGYGFGFFGTTQNEGGLSGILEIGFTSDKNLFLLNYLSGTSFNILGSPGVDVTELNLQFGRELKVTDWFSVEGFAGIGYFNQESKGKFSTASISLITIPMRLKLVCYTGKHFALVSNTNFSLNGVSTNISSNLTFQHSF